MKLTEYIKKALEIPKKIFKRFPFSVSLSILASLIIAIFLENDFLEDTILFIILLPIGILFSEIFFKDNKKIEIISFIISFIIAILGNKYIKESNELLIRLTIIYCITLVILGLIRLYKDSKLPLNEYITRVATNIFKVQVVSGILSSGILAITGIIVLLFKSPEMIIVRTELILFGSFVIPAYIYALSDTTAEVWDFIKFILKNITSVILIITFAVIYIYMLKIFITFKIPSNHIFRITGLLFIIGLPIWTMISSFEKENVLVKINNYLPIAFIPFIGLQIYSIIVRIAGNGLTIIRYCGVLLIIFEILYIIIYILKKENLHYLGYVLIAMSIIGIIVPKINAEDMVVNSQYKRIIKYLESEKHTKEEDNSVFSSYYYLIDFKEGEALLNNLTPKQIELITGDKQIDYSCYYKDDDTKLNNFDVSGYSKLNEFYISKYDLQESYNVFRNIKINSYNVNMESAIRRFVQNQKEDYDYKYIDDIVSDEYKVVINRIDVCIEDSIITSYTIGGYILEK